MRYLRQNSRKADKVPKSCLIALNLSFNTYLSIKSLKNADFLWQSVLCFVLWGEFCSLRWARSAQRRKRLSLTGWRLIIACTGLDMLMFDKFCVIFYNFFFRHFEEKFQQEVQRWTVFLRQKIRKNIYHFDMVYGYHQTQKIHSKLLLKIQKQTLYFPYDVEGSYGGEALARDVAQLRALNKQLVKIFIQH